MVETFTINPLECNHAPFGVNTFKGGVTMTKYREILRLKSLELSQQNIADSCNVFKKTVNRVFKRARELSIF